MPAGTAAPTHATIGEADYYLRVVCRRTEAYNHCPEGFLFRLPGIAHVRTNRS